MSITVSSSTAYSGRANPSVAASITAAITAAIAASISSTIATSSSKCCSRTERVSDFKRTGHWQHKQRRRGNHCYAMFSRHVFSSLHTSF
jgi:hypothetical protein